MRIRGSCVAVALVLVLAARLAAGAACAGDEGASFVSGPETAKRLEVRLAGDARQVLAALGELFGVPVVVDADFPARSLRLRLDPVDFDAALRVAAEAAGAFWVRREDGIIFVSANTPEKRRLYEPQSVQTFSLAGSTTDELTEAVRLLREVFDMRRIQVDTRTSTFSVRDTPERLRLASEMLEQLRRERGEVLVDVLLLEVDRERARRLGILPPQQTVTVHLGTRFVDLEQTESIINILRSLLERGLIPERFLGVSLQTLLAALASADPALIEAALPPFIIFGGGATTYAASLPGATLNLLELASITRSLRRARLRARDGQEATLFVGQEFPVVLATFSSLFFPPQVLELIKQGLFVPPVPAVQHQPLGLKLAATPHLHAGREVTLQLKLDLRELSPVTLNTIPVFTNRVVEQTARLRAGEVMLLAGIRSHTRQDSRQGTPGLATLTGTGPLFSAQDARTQETELLVLVAPRIVRPSLIEKPAPRALYIGTELRFSPLGPAPPPATAPQPPQPQQP